MPGKNTAVDELSAIKAKYEGQQNGPQLAGSTPDPGRGGILSPSVLTMLAILLAIVAGASLTLSYGKLRSLSERERALAQKEGRVNECEQRLVSLNTDIAKMEARKEQLKAENILLEADVAKGAEAAAEARTLSVMLPRMQNEIGVENGRIQALKSEKEGLDSAVSNARATLDTIKSSYFSTQSGLKETETALAAKRTELSSLLSNIAKNQADFEGLVQTYKNKESALASLNDEIKKREKERDEQIRQRDEAWTALSGIQTSISQLRAEHASQTGEITTMSGKLSQLNAQVSAEKKNISELESEKSKLTTEVARLEGERAISQQIIQQKGEADAQLSSLKGQCQAQQALLKDATTKLGDLNKEIGDLETKRLGLERAVSQLIGRQSALSSSAALNSQSEP